MKSYLSVFRSAKPQRWLDDPDVLETIDEHAPRPAFGGEQLPSVSVEEKQVLCIKFDSEPRIVKKDKKEYHWTNATLLEPAPCYFKEKGDDKEMPAGTKVSMNINRHKVLRRCLEPFEPLTNKELAIANFGRVIKTKQGKAYKYRAMTYADLKKKMGAK